MKYLKKLEEESWNRKQRSKLAIPSRSPASSQTLRSLTCTLTVSCMSKRMKSKDHTIKRLRGQRNILRRAAQTSVKEVQEIDDEGEEGPIHEKVVQDSGDNDREEMRKPPSFTNDSPVLC